MVCDWVSGEPQNLEPEKQHNWGWFTWQSLPRPLFLSIENLLKLDFDPMTAKPIPYFSQTEAP
jgi:8-oxo-dGTP diphosphatase